MNACIVTAETSKRKMEQKLFDIILFPKREKHDANEKNMWTSMWKECHNRMC